jgi:hypothetical protein
MKYDYSLISSVALFVALKIQGHAYDVTSLRIYLDNYCIKEFEKCVQEFLALWNTMRTTTLYANYEAVYNKYLTRYNFDGKGLEPPVVTNIDLESWFYTKKNK